MYSFASAKDLITIIWCVADTAPHRRIIFALIFKKRDNNKQNENRHHKMRCLMKMCVRAHKSRIHPSSTSQSAALINPSHFIFRRIFLSYPRHASMLLFCPLSVPSPIITLFVYCITHFMRFELLLLRVTIWMNSFIHEKKERINCFSLELKQSWRHIRYTLAFWEAHGYIWFLWNACVRASSSQCLNSQIPRKKCNKRWNLSQ